MTDRRLFGAAANNGGVNVGHGDGTLDWRSIEYTPHDAPPARR
jgi:hypothetical protein